MPAPSTAEEFLELVRKSGVLEEKRLDAYLEKIRAVSTVPPEPGKVAGLLVRDGLLTQFQAEQFLQGKWRRFTIGKYKVLERIASGGMGSVYLCEHKFMRRRAAVKVLPTAKANDPSSLERFYREARAVAALDHPNIVRAYDIDQEENLHFLVMEFVDGSSLQDVVKKSGPLDPVRAAHYISQAALGLQHAHDVAGLVHRDIKPGNLIVDRGGTVKILDMGLARFFYDEEDLLTQKYDENVLGTADYLAPEQALDSHSVDIRADIYSLGATLYFCLTGRTPFNEGTVAQKLIWHQTRQPKPIRALRADVPQGLVAVIDKMMAKDPAQRFQIPREVVQALAPWTQSTIAPPLETEMPPLGPAGSSSSPRESTAEPVASPDLLLPPAPKPRKNGPTRPVGQATAAATPLAAPSPHPPPKAPLADSQSARTPEPAHDETDVPIVKKPAESAADFKDNGFVLPAVGTTTAQEEDSLCWENLADTKDLSAHADTDTRGPKKSAARKLRETQLALFARPERIQLWWVVGIVAGALLLALLIALIWAFAGDTPPPTPVSQGKAGPIRLIVNSTQKNSPLKRIRDALGPAKANPGSVIVVQDRIIKEQVDLSDLQQVTLQTEGDQPVVWQCPERLDNASYLVYINEVAGVHLRGFTFDGGDKVEEIFLLFGECPGLTLENVRMRGFKRRGIRVTNCAGTSERPVAFQDLLISTTKGAEAAIAFDLNPKIEHPKLNQHFAIQNCHFDGAYKNVIEQSEPARPREVTWENNILVPQPGQKPIVVAAPK